MKKLVLVAALGTIFSGTALAESQLNQSVLPDNTKESIKGLYSAETINIKIGDLISENDINAALLRSNASTPEEASRVITNLYRERGYLAARAFVLKETGDVVVIEAKANIIMMDGKRINSVSDLNIKDVSRYQLSRTAASYGKELSINVSPIDFETKTVDVTFSAIDTDEASRRGTVSVNTYGSRYSGSTVLSASGVAHEDGLFLEGQVLRGVDWIDPNSDGGRFLAFQAKGSTMTDTVFEESGLELFVVSNKQGGDLDILNMSGNSKQFTGFAEQVHENVFGLSADIKVKQTLTYVEEDSEIGALNLNETQQHVLAGIEATWMDSIDRSTNYHVALRYNQSLWGDREYNVAPIMGEFGTQGQVFGLSGQFNNRLDSGWGYRLDGDIQKGSDGISHTLYTFGGGRGAGSAHAAGTIAGVSGYRANLSLFSPARYHSGTGIDYLPFMSFNGAVAQDALGVDRSVRSLEAGVYYSVNNTVTGTVSYSLDPVLDVDRFNAELSYNF